MLLEGERWQLSSQAILTSLDLFIPLFFCCFCLFLHFLLSFIRLSIRLVRPVRRRRLDTTFLAQAHRTRYQTWPGPGSSRVRKSRPPTHCIQLFKLFSILFLFLAAYYFFFFFICLGLGRRFALSSSPVASLPSFPSKVFTVFDLFYLVCYTAPDDPHLRPVALGVVPLFLSSRLSLAT